MLRGAGVQWSAAALRDQDCVRLGFRLRGGVNGYDLGLWTRNGSIDRVQECGVEDGYLHKTMERMKLVVRMYTHLNEDIAVTLGEGKLLDDERDVCWTYRPWKVSEVVAVP